MQRKTLNIKVLINQFKSHMIIQLIKMLKSKYPCRRTTVKLLVIFRIGSHLSAGMLEDQASSTEVPCHE